MPICHLCKRKYNTDVGHVCWMPHGDRGPVLLPTKGTPGVFPAVPVIEPCGSLESEEPRRCLKCGVVFWGDHACPLPEYPPIHPSFGCTDKVLPLPALNGVPSDKLVADIQQIIDGLPQVIDEVRGLTQEIRERSRCPGVESNEIALTLDEWQRVKDTLNHYAHFSISGAKARATIVKLREKGRM